MAQAREAIQRPAEPVALRKQEEVRPTETSRPHPFLHLQRAAGNQAVLSLLESRRQVQTEPTTNYLRDDRLSSRSISIQHKLTISQSEDPYEKEADRLADLVTRPATSTETNDKLKFTAKVAQPRSVVMRQTALDPREAVDPPDTDDGSKPHQYDDDANLDSAYQEWLHYDPEKDIEETALVNRINKEVFGPINQERNKIAADSFEITEAKKTAFPTNTLEPGASPARQSLFNALSYTWLHSSTAENTNRQQQIGVTQPAGDLAATGKIMGRSFGAPSPKGTVWDYRGEKTSATGLDFDSTIDSSGIEGKDNISGYAEFKDSKGQTVFVPQLGFSIKPTVDTRQIMCGDVSIVKPGRAKRLGGPSGQGVTSSSASDFLHGGKHFFGKGTQATTTGKGEVLGQRSGPGKPVYWYLSQLPEDEDKREKINESMKKKADVIMDAKSKSYENLKQYYLRRSAFIAKYRDQLK